MGYTHYWRHTGFTLDQWKNLLTFTRNLISVTRIPIGNAYGDKGSSPRLDDVCIQFNGVGEDSCETFSLIRDGQDFEFCKTRRLPYDEIVVKVMCEAMRINPRFIPSSDGGPAVFETRA